MEKNFKFDTYIQFKKMKRNSNNNFLCYFLRHEWSPGVNDMSDSLGKYHWNSNKKKMY